MVDYMRSLGGSWEDLWNCGKKYEVGILERVRKVDSARQRRVCSLSFLFDSLAKTRNLVDCGGFKLCSTEIEIAQIDFENLDQALCTASRQS